MRTWNGNAAVAANNNNNSNSNSNNIADDNHFEAGSDDDGDGDDEGIPYSFSVEMDENGNVTTSGFEINDHNHDDNNKNGHRQTTGTMMDDEEFGGGGGGQEEEKQPDPSLMVVETTMTTPSRRRELQQQEQPGRLLSAGNNNNTPSSSGGDDTTTTTTTNNNNNNNSSPRQQQQPNRSVSPRSWTARSKPSPKREKLIQSLRGSLRRQSSPPAARRLSPPPATTTNDDDATSSGSVGPNNSHRVSTPPTSSTRRPAAEAERGMMPPVSPQRQQHRHPIITQQQQLVWSTPPRRQQDRQEREYVEYKPSMPTDEEEDTSENNEVRTHDTNETNDGQAYLSAEDTFSDENNDHHTNHAGETNTYDDDEEAEEYEETSTDGQSSEWDVAMKRGKATVIGQAAKDFFIASLPSVFAVGGGTTGTASVVPTTTTVPLSYRRRRLQHPSFTNTTTDEDEDNDEGTTTTTTVPRPQQQQQLATPSHSKSNLTTSDDDDDDDDQHFSTPMTHHYDSNGNLIESFSQNDDDDDDEGGKADESDLNARLSTSYSRDTEGYEHSFEDNDNIDDDGNDLEDDDEEEEEEGDDDEEDDDDDDEDDGADTAPVSRTTLTTRNGSTPSPTQRPRGKGSVVVHVQSGRSTEQDTPSLGTRPPPTRHYNEEELSAGILPEVFINMRQKIEALSMFDADILRFTANATDEAREALKRSSQQSISAAILVTLTHKRYERRRLASIHIEQVVRSLISEHIEQQKQLAQLQPHAKSYAISRELERVRAILLLLSEDYVRSTNEDARKGGVLALGACAIGLKKADPADPVIKECHDLILASVVHACQDQAPRVRYYSAESLMNIVRAVPALAVEHFFILYEVLRCLFADVNPVVRGGAVKYDKQLKMTIVGAMNAGTFAVDACVPVFARFVYVKNKATKQLTLTWLLELNEKLIGAPILEFLHIFMGGVIEMVADPSVAIRSSALAFLQSVLPKLLDVESSEAIDDFEEQANKVDFDKILQSLVTMMEHASPSVRKVAVYWMFKIVKAHMEHTDPNKLAMPGGEKPSPASISVRNSVPHVLPGILLSIGDTSSTLTSGPSAKEEFLPDQTTQSLAEQTNACLQEAVSRDGKAFVEYLDGFIVALREELATSGGFSSKNPPAMERSSYRVDIPQDGTGIERPGWFRASRDIDAKNTNAVASSRLCALQWVIVLYENVVPDQLKADYAREFVTAIIRQLVDKPPETIVKKSLEVLAKITVPVSGEDVHRHVGSNPLAGLAVKTRQVDGTVEAQEFPMTESSVSYALNILESDRRRLRSRDNEVFASLVQLHSQHEELMTDLSKVITYMCELQPPEFVMVSFATELDRYVRQCKVKSSQTTISSGNSNNNSMARELKFASSFVQHLNHVLLNAPEAEELRIILKDCIAFRDNTERHHQRSRLFFILLHSFSHNLAAAISLCLWVGSYRTACLVLSQIDPLEITLVTLLEIDSLIEILERPLFRHLHVRMLESDSATLDEGSGAMLFQLFKSLLMIVPQSTGYGILRDRLASVARFRQSATKPLRKKPIAQETKGFVARVTSTRKWHCECAWRGIRQESLEEPSRKKGNAVVAVAADQETAEQGVDAGRRGWSGSPTRKEHMAANRRHQDAKDDPPQRVGGPRTLLGESSVVSTTVVTRRRDESSKDEAAAAAATVSSAKDKNDGAVNPAAEHVDDSSTDNHIGDVVVDGDDNGTTQDTVQEWKTFWVDSTTTTTTT